MIFHSKPDWCVLAAIAIAIAAILTGAHLVVAGPVLLVLMLCAYPQTYVVTAEGLMVHDALSRRIIPYRVITFAGREPKSLFWAGRIRVRYGLASSVLLAPAKFDALFAAIEAASPQLVKRTGDLVLRDRHVEYALSPSGRLKIVG